MRNAGLVSNVPPHSKSLKKRAPIFQSVGGYEDGYRKPLNKPTNTAHCLSFHVVPTKNVKNITLKQSKVSKQKFSVPRKPLAFKLTGQVKCFHVRKGYGFIHSVDLDSDIFIHYSAITKNNPKKLMKSVRKGEIVQFDVVMGSKNLPEAVNVTGPNNQPVQGSWYAPDRKQNYSKGFNLQQRLQQVSCMNNSHHKFGNKQQKNKRSINYRKCYNIIQSPQFSHFKRHEQNFTFNYCNSQETKSGPSESDYESDQSMITQNNSGQGIHKEC